MRVTNIVELRLPLSAHPRRVAAATAMMADAIEAAFPQAEDLTLVVENLHMRVRLRAWNEESKKAGMAFRDFIRNPTLETPAVDVAGLADVLERYCREHLEDEISFWIPRGRKPWRVVDKEFIQHLAIVTNERLLEVHGVDERKRLFGSTIITTPVFRVGRTSANADLKARIKVGTKYIEVKIAHKVFGEFCEAAKHGRPVRVSVAATWIKTKDDVLQILPLGSVATGIEEKPSGRVNAQLVSIGRVVTDEEAAFLWAGLAGGDDE